MCLISLQACHVCGLIYKYLETRCDEFLANVDLQRKKVYTVRTAFGWSPSHGCERLEIHRRICVKAICKKCFEMDPATNAMSIYDVHFGSLVFDETWDERVIRLGNERATRVDTPSPY